MRATVTAILECSGFRVREYASAGELLSEGALPDADCVLTDLRMPGIDGLSLLTRLRAVGSAVPVIVVTGHGDVSLAVRAMKLGACDFIEKPFAPETLVEAVRAAVSEPRTLSREARRALARERFARLTQREGQVLDQVLLGLRHREIGDQLAISPRTVEVFRSRIMAKTECQTVQELVRVAIEAGRG
ncbi:response regulator [Methylobacterium sp. J-070]|nr:response regulator [Methylobacterium sp. J-070]